ncbi:hypothetical protein BH23BAC3_BH23BAC3_00640 [soil metagenome]
MDSALDYYVKKGNTRVEGWLTKIAMKAIVELNVIQDEESIKGPVCEIGVHHGRLFILLHLLSDDPEMSVAWDIFELQNENPHNSGRGDIDALMVNMNKFDCDLSRIKIITKNSQDLESKEILIECDGKPRLFSIDGGHTAEITYNDIQIAARSICEKGIIILDDFFNEAWPGVAEGTCRYMFENPGLYPVAIIGNKVMLTNSTDGAKMYIHNLDFNYPGYIRKHSIFFGHDVLCYTPLNTNIIWKHLRDRPLGKFIKQLLKR